MLHGEQGGAGGAWAGRGRRHPIRQIRESADPAIQPCCMMMAGTLAAPGLPGPPTRPPTHLRRLRATLLIVSAGLQPPLCPSYLRGGRQGQQQQGEGGTGRPLRTAAAVWAAASGGGGGQRVAGRRGGTCSSSQRQKPASQVRHWANDQPSKQRNQQAMQAPPPIDTPPLHHCATHRMSRQMCPLL